MRPRLKLKPDTSPEKVSACELIRFQYGIWRSAYNSSRRAAADIRLQPFDWPPEAYRKQCVWGEIYDRMMPEVNPLWAIRYDFEQAIESGLPVIVWGHTQKIKNDDGKVVAAVQATNGRQICIKKRVPEYLQASKAYAHEQEIKAHNSIRALDSRLHAAALVINSRDEEMLLSYLKREYELDPVVELLWRYGRNFESDATLRYHARCAFASMPRLYAAVPDKVKLLFELLPLFEVNDELRSCTPVRIDRLLHA